MVAACACRQLQLAQLPRFRHSHVQNITRQAERHEAQLHTSLGDNVEISNCETSRRNTTICPMPSIVSRYLKEASIPLLQAAQGSPPIPWFPLFGYTSNIFTRGPLASDRFLRRNRGRSQANEQTSGYYVAATDGFDTFENGVLLCNRPFVAVMC